MLADTGDRDVRGRRDRRGDPDRAGRHDARRCVTAARGRSRGTGAGGGHGRGRPSRRSRPHHERPRCRAARRPRGRAGGDVPGGAGWSVRRGDVRRADPSARWGRRPLRLRLARRGVQAPTSSPTRSSTWRVRRGDEPVGRTSTSWCGACPRRRAHRGGRPAVRRAALRVARELASATIEQRRARLRRSGPRAGAIRRSRGLRDPAGGVGGPAHRHVPLRPAARATGADACSTREVLARALTNGAYDWARVRNVTGELSGLALVRELLAGTANGAVRRADPRARLPGHGDREAAVGHAVRRPRRVVGRRRRRYARRSPRATPTPTRCSRCARAKRAASDHRHRLRDERRADRPRAEADCHREHRQRGRAGRPPWTPDRVVVRSSASRAGEPVPMGRTWARACRPATCD